VIQTAGDLLSRQIIRDLLDRSVWMISVSSLDDFHQTIAREDRDAFRERLTALFEASGMRASGLQSSVRKWMDEFFTAMRACPNWNAFEEQHIHVEGMKHVSDIMRRDAHTVAPDTPIEEVLRTIDCNNIQRVCVVDVDGWFLGLISDRDLLIAFADRHPGIWDYFAGKMPFRERSRRSRELRDLLRARTAVEVMNTDIVTIRENATIEEAIRLMLDRAIKRLPVLDEDGKFRGMISRDSLLRAGFASSQR
jgi:CBS domain-containing protein